MHMNAFLFFFSLFLFYPAHSPFLPPFHFSHTAWPRLALPFPFPSSCKAQSSRPPPLPFPSPAALSASPSSSLPLSLTARWALPIVFTPYLEPDLGSTQSSVVARRPRATLGPHIEASPSAPMKGAAPVPLIPSKPQSPPLASQPLLPSSGALPSCRSATALSPSSAAEASCGGDHRHWPFSPLHPVFPCAQLLAVTTLPCLTMGCPLRSPSCHPEPLDAFPIAPSFFPCNPRLKSSPDNRFQPSSVRLPPCAAASRRAPPPAVWQNQSA
jgi:hypothetical protein